MSKNLKNLKKQNQTYVKIKADYFLADNLKHV